MQPRSLQQVLTELDSVYQPQIDSLRTRQAAIPGQMQAEEAGLNAQKDQGYTDILNGARRRGLGFAGIPLGEQAQYNATQYAPALARLRQQSKDQAMSLEDAILGIQERRNAQGQSIFENERNFAEQQRQFNEQMAESRRQASAAAAAANAFSPSLGAYGGGQQAPVSKAGAVQRASDKGFNFTDQNGRAISAAAYAAATGTPFRTLLQRMADAGDAGAKTALGFVGNDFGYDRSKVNSQALTTLYNNLTYGVKPNATYTAPKAAAPATAQRSGGLLPSLTGNMSILPRLGAF